MTAFYHEIQIEHHDVTSTLMTNVALGAVMLNEQSNGLLANSEQIEQDEGKKV